MKYKKLYDELYENGYHSNFKTNHTKHLYAYVDKFIGPAGKVLDVGCSHGTAVYHLNKRGYDSHGIDISSVAIELCNKRKIKNCKVSSVANIDYDDQYFDGLVSSDTFEHLDPSEIESALLECNRVLKKGGVGIMLIATRKEVNRHYDFVAKKYGLTNLHTSIFNAEDWTNKIKSVFPFLEVIVKKRGAIFIFKK